jgi:hypothetical protein
LGCSEAWDVLYLGRFAFGTFCSLTGLVCFVAGTFLVGTFCSWDITPCDKKCEPSETKFSIKKTFQGIKPFYATDISTYTSNDPPLFLADLSQPLGPGGHTSFYTAVILLFQCAVKLILLNLILS